MTPRLLLVDDSEMVRDLIVRVLGGAFDTDAIDQASDGGSALQLLRARMSSGGPLPTVIVSDIDMRPGMCGEEFVRELAKDERLASIPVLLSSSEPNVRETARRLGVHAFEKRGSLVAIRDVILQLVAAATVQSTRVATEAPAEPDDALVRGFHDKLLRVRALAEDPDVYDAAFRVAVRKVLDDTTPVVDDRATRIAALEAEVDRLDAALVESQRVQDKAVDGLEERCMQVVTEVEKASGCAPLTFQEAVIEIGRLGRSVQAGCQKLLDRTQQRDEQAKALGFIDALLRAIVVDTARPTEAHRTAVEARGIIAALRALHPDLVAQMSAPADA